MIPKIIHYCWFGGNEKNQKVMKCINSWKTYLPDYTLVEWNENNCNINILPYVKQAYDNGKYAFVSDYFRLKALYEVGGIYFDTDYELIDSIKNILEEGNKLITGMESMNDALTAVIAAEPANPLIKELMDSYSSKVFLGNNGEMDLTPINKGFSAILKKNGINIGNNRLQKTESGIVFYPVDVLCGFDVENWHEKTTENTVGIHHMDMSWGTPQMKRHLKLIHSLQGLLGYRLYDKIKKITGTIR